MSVSIKGEKELAAELERRFGAAKMNQVSDNALKAGAKVFVKELRAQVSTYSDKTGYSKGYTLEEITVSEPMTLNGVRMVRVHWKGPKGRYRVVHLNEWGTINNPRPRGKGAIARAMRNAESEYRRAVKQALKDGL